LARCWHRRDWRQPLGHVDRRLAALVALQEAGRGELDEVAVAGGIGGDQGQMEARELARRARRMILDDVDLAAEDRLDLMLAAGGEELHRSVHHPVVGQRQRRLTERGGTLGEGVDLACSVEQRVLGVDVEVGTGRRHRRCV
jgi:hypothetical protein